MIVKFKGKNIHYQDTGHGEAIVLLHGFMESSGIWNDFARRLAPHFRVISPDLPGHGSSECLDEVHPMELMAEMTRDLLDSCGVKECLMIGHSMGGYVSLAFAKMYPEMLRGIGLFHSQAAADTPEAKVNRDRTIAFIRQNHGGFIRQFIPDLFAPDNREKYRKEISALIDASSGITSQAIIAAMEGMKIRSDHRRVLENLSIPVMFILGKLDTRIPLDQGLLQASLARHSEVLVLRDIAHMGYIEEAEATFRFLESFASAALST